MSQNALVIYNPASGNPADIEVCLGTIVHKLCKEGGYATTVRPTLPDMAHEQCRELIKNSNDLDLIAVAGGDGTIRLVLGAVSSATPQTPVAIIPLGTGNQLARNLKLYDESLLADPLSESVKVMLHGQPTRIDLGTMNGEYFCVAAGAGPLSDAVIAPSRRDKSNLRMLAYVGSIIQNIALPPVVFRLRTGNDSFQVNASGVFITNVADLGVGTLSNSAQVNDGLLDLCVMNPTDFSDYMQLGFRFTSGNIIGGEAPYYIRKVSSVNVEVVPVESRLSDLQAIAHKVRTTLKGEPELPPVYDQVTAMIDGDAFGTTPMQIDVHPNAVSVLVWGK
jgi:diacylglycerol kinase family enzyme